MIILYVLNYSKLNDVIIEKYINNFIKLLKANEINNEFKIKFCDMGTKNRFLEHIDRSVKTVFDNINVIKEVNDYINFKSNNQDIQKHKLVFLGEFLKTSSPWGEATDCMAVIKEVQEKVVWHEISHLIGASDHYDDDFSALSICKDPQHCIMTYGKLEGVFCTQSIQEMKNYLETI